MIGSVLLARVVKPALLALVVIAVALAGPPASATESAPTPAPTPVPTSLTLVAPARADVTATVPLVATLLRTDPATGTAVPVAGVPVELHRRQGGVWKRIATVGTDANGVARGTVKVLPLTADNVVRAAFAGSPDPVAPLARAISEEHTVTPVVHRATMAIAGAARVVDETSTDLRMSFRADGRRVTGVGDLWQRQERGAWRKHSVVRFDARGNATVRVTPRVDTEWKVAGRAAAWWSAATSPVHVLDNVPPTAPVSYPAKAPRPTITLPRQARAVGKGANASSTAVPNAVWRTMVGRSWRSGCPVGRSSLRLVEVNYWGYDGYRYRGQLVVNKAIATKTKKAFTALYAKQLPIRSMYLVDRFGYSSRLGGADNYGSMAAGNTSAFNCRGVVGNPRVRSPHSYGRSIDINTWENPYHSRTGVVPNTWWASRSHPEVGWRNSSHPVVKVLRANGFRWTYGNSDAHHFDG